MFITIKLKNYLSDFKISFANQRPRRYMGMAPKFVTHAVLKADDVEEKCAAKQFKYLEKKMCERD